MSGLYHAIGFAAFWFIIAGAAIGPLLLIYVMAIHGRFNAILFRKTVHRMSIASWHQSRAIRMGQPKDAKHDWPADDFPINERPLYVSYRIGKRRMFFLAGFMDNRRSDVIRGDHP